jgi:hypothetical protein
VWVLLVTLYARCEAAATELHRRNPGALPVCAKQTENER